MSTGAPCAGAGAERETVREKWDPVWTPESQCVLIEVCFEQPCSPLSSAHGQHGPGAVNICACFPLHGQCVGLLVFQP